MLENIINKGLRAEFMNLHLLEASLGPNVTSVMWKYEASRAQTL